LLKCYLCGLVGPHRARTRARVFAALATFGRGYVYGNGSFANEGVE